MVKNSVSNGSKNSPLWAHSCLVPARAFGPQAPFFLQMQR
jgi:hypothetical protein